MRNVDATREIARATKISQSWSEARRNVFEWIRIVCWIFFRYFRAPFPMPRINTLNLTETKCDNAATSAPSARTRTRHKSYAFFQMSDDCLWDNSVPNSYLRPGAPSTRKVLKIVFPECSSEWNTVQFSTEVHRSRSKRFPFPEEQEWIPTSN